ncbi:MAG: HupE/UreJ family protein [Chitinophagaceae bacterium]|nr:HupE/UreJ family protein [Chitinophagaceae bacterium]
MQDLGFYFDLGWHHIIDWHALDHLLFVLALSAIYLMVNWRQVLVLVTAFTIGHSLTLALSVYDIVRVNDRWVEFLIPCTIMATALFNFFQREFRPRSLRLNYFLALFFGLIHGLGFANAIRFMLAGDQGIGWGLFGFNLGLEAGQVVVVSGILITAYIVVDQIGLPRKWWVWVLSALAFSIALTMAWNRWPL